MEKKKTWHIDKVPRGSCNGTFVTDGYVDRKFKMKLDVPARKINAHVRER